MKKAKLLAPRNAAREILTDTDAQRMLESGSWVIAEIPKLVTPNAKRQRKFKRKRAEEGFKRLEVLLSKRVFEALQNRRRNGEPMAALIKRLLELPDNDDKEGQLGRQK